MQPFDFGTPKMVEFLRPGDDAVDRSDNGSRVIELEVCQIITESQLLKFTQ